MGKLLRNPFVLMLLAGLSYLGATAAVLKLNWAKLSTPLAAEASTEKARPSLVTVGARPFDLWSAETNEMIAELGREKARLEERSRDLDTLKTQLDGEHTELDRLKDEIAKSRQELDKAATELGEEETRNLKPLAQTYAKLTPRAAVAIFRELDDSTALKILSLMKNDQVSIIFEEIAGAPQRHAREADALQPPHRAGVVLVVAHQPPRLHDRAGDDVVGDHHAAPDAVEQLLLGDHAVALPQQQHQGVEDLGLDVEARAAARHLARRRVDLEISEAKPVLAQDAALAG